MVSIEKREKECNENGGWMNYCGCEMVLYEVQYHRASCPFSHSLCCIYIILSFGNKSKGIFMYRKRVLENRTEYFRRILNSRWTRHLNV